MDGYGKRADLIVHEREPFNAETGLAALDEGPLTATDAFYVRGHGAVPEIDPATWRLHVDGAVERELDLSSPPCARPSWSARRRRRCSAPATGARA